VSNQRYQLRMFDVIMLVISLVIGMGIFRTPATVAARSGDITIFYAVWIVGGIIALCGALSFAEVGRRMPVTGAYYRVFAQAYHPTIAFAVNIIILVSNAASAAGVGIIGAEYIQGWLPSIPTSYTAIVMIGILFVLNLLGLRASSQVQNVLISLKVAMLACIIAAMVFVDPAAPSATVAATPSTGGMWAAFGMALIGVSFTYGGYQSTINFGGEIQNSERTMPIAIVIGVVIITAIYLLASMSYVHVLSFDTLAQSKSIAALVINKLFGPSGSAVVSGMMIISVFGYINVAMLSNPRVINAMSQDGVLPSAIARSTNAHGVNTGALVSFTLLSIVCVYYGESFEKILNYTIFIDSIGLGCGAAAIYYLHGPKIPSYTHVAAAVFVGSCVYTAVNLFVNEPVTAIAGTGLFAAVALLGMISLYFSGKT